MKQVVHTLQQALEKEKARVKDLQEQVWSPGLKRLDAPLKVIQTVVSAELLWFTCSTMW